MIAWLKKGGVEGHLQGLYAIQNDAKTRTL